MKDTMAGNTAGREGVELGFLRENLPFLTRALRAYIRAENADFFSGLETEQGEIAVISVIGLNPGISQNDVAAMLVFKKSAVTKLIKHLEERGLVERKKVISDKRFNALTLTKAGEEKYRRVRAQMDAQHKALLAPFSPDERDQLFALVNRLHAHLLNRHADRTGTRGSIAGGSED